MAFGGKFGIDDDTETPNTLTVGFSYGDAQLVIEVRGKMTNGEGVRQPHVVTAGPTAAAAGQAGTVRGRCGSSGGASGRSGAKAGGPAGNPLTSAVGDLFYGSDGWLR